MPNIHRMVRNAWAHLTIFYLNFLDLPKRIRLSIYASSGVVILASCYLFYGVKVDARIDRAEKLCQRDYPLAITVTNRTFTDVLRVRMLLDARDAGSEKNELMQPRIVFERARYGDIRPLMSMESATLCYRDWSLSNYKIDQLVSPKVKVTDYDVDYAQ